MRPKESVIFRNRTLDHINKGYHAEDIYEQCGKLAEAGIDFWMTFLNGAAGKEHSMDLLAAIRRNKRTL